MFYKVIKPLQKITSWNLPLNWHLFYVSAGQNAKSHLVKSTFIVIETHLRVAPLWNPWKWLTLDNNLC